MANDNDLLKNIKPCFETSNSRVFVNLHNAACEKACKVLGLAYDDMINTFMINTAVTTDGTHLPDEIIEADEKDVGKYFGKEGKYEFGIVLQFLDFQNPTKDEVAAAGNGNDAIAKAVRKKNEAGFKRLRETSFEAIKEYFRWFAGADQDVSESDLVEFIPDYNDGKIMCKNYSIQVIDEDQYGAYFGIAYDPNAKRTKSQEHADIDSMSDRERHEYEKNRQKETENGNDEVGSDFIPRVGYKLGYTLSYKESKKKADVENPSANS